MIGPAVVKTLHNNWPGSMHFRFSLVRIGVWFPKPQMFQNLSYEIPIFDEADNLYLMTTLRTAQRVHFPDLANCT